LYHQIADCLRDRVESGGFPDGVLPSEERLAEMFGVGRDAVRDALAVLVNEGLSQKRRGRQATVRQRGPASVVDIPGDAVVSARMPSAEEQYRLNMSGGIPILVVHSGSNQVTYPADRVQLRSVTS
jgi:GntR family transcriptional regulator